MSQPAPPPPDSPPPAALVSLFAEFLAIAATPGQWQSQLLSALTEAFPPTLIRRVAVVVQFEQQWRSLGLRSSAPALPGAVIAEALHRGSPVRANVDYCVPLTGLHQPPAVLLFELLNPQGVVPAELAAAAAAVAGPLGDLLSAITQREQAEAKSARQQQLLDHSARWDRTAGIEQLFEQLAESSCQLLDAERASIFLWDRRGHRLVARPALGVEQQSLIVADDRGIVGQVLRSGEAQRWRVGVGRDLVNRQVDQLTGFKTHSLLAVPLRARNQRPVGVFEVLNHRQGGFSESDEELLTELARHAATAIESTRERDLLLASRDALARRVAQPLSLLGDSPPLQRLRQSISRAAPSDLSVLICGPNGVGKEVVAQQIHWLSPRRHQRFVAINCAAIAESLLDSELFGHERGAFTDAHQTRVGLFEQAHGGTLLLDEVGDLSAAGQAKLLRVLEEHAVVRIGGTERIPVDVRIIAATNQPLAQRIAERRFREDLFFRLSVIMLEVPPLAARGDDVLLLARQFLTESCERQNRRVPELTEQAQQALRNHPWPGNVRELRNCMERAAYLSEDDELQSGDLWLPRRDRWGPEAASPVQLGADRTSAEALADATRTFQVQHIRQAIEAAGGNLTAAARQLGLHRANLYRKMQQLGIDPDSPEGRTG